MGKKPVSPIGRVSFPELFVPKAFDTDQPKYSVTLIFKEGVDLTAMKAAATAAAREFWPKGTPSGLRTPFRDAGDKTDLDGYEPGMTFVRFSSKNRPGVVGPSKAPIHPESEELYAGCYGRVSYSVYAYDQKGNRGVSFGLLNFQKTGDGAPFGNRSDPDEDFDEVEASFADEGIEDELASDDMFE